MRGEAGAMSAAVIPITRRLPLVSERPRTRGDCLDGPRPCPWGSCRYHLVADPAFSCVLDVADEGGVALDTVGRALGFTREFARQIEEKALAKIARQPGELGAWDDGDGEHRRNHGLSRTARAIDGIERAARTERDEVDDDAAPPIRISFFASPDVDIDGLEAVERADELVADAVWTMFVKDSNGRGFGIRKKRSAAQIAATERARAQMWAARGGRSMNGTTTNGASPALNGKLRAALEVYNALKSTYGRVPNAAEVSGRLDIGYQAARYQLHQLAAMGLAEIAPRGGTRPKAETKATPPAETRPVEAKAKSGRARGLAAGEKRRESKATAPASTGSAVDVLRAELARAERRVEALRAALAVLEEAS